MSALGVKQAPITHRLTFGMGLPATLHYGPGASHDTGGQEQGAFYTDQQAWITLANKDAVLCRTCQRAAGDLDADEWTVVVTYASGVVAETRCAAFYMLARVITEARESHFDEGPITSIVIV